MELKSKVSPMTQIFEYCCIGYVDDSSILNFSIDHGWNIFNSKSQNNWTTFKSLTCCTQSPHGTTEFLIGHAAVLLLLTPHLSHCLWLEELEDALTTVLPLQEALVPLWVDEDVPDEFPQVSASRRWKNQPRLARQWSVFNIFFGIFLQLIFFDVFLPCLLFFVVQ